MRQAGKTNLLTISPVIQLSTLESAIVSRGRVVHPKCGKTFTNSDRVGHCAACCETIFGLRAFDEHRKNGSCLPLENGKRQFWQDRNGDWHWGPRRKDTTYL